MWAIRSKWLVMAFSKSSLDKSKRHTFSHQRIYVAFNPSTFTNPIGIYLGRRHSAFPGAKNVVDVLFLTRPFFYGFQQTKTNSFYHLKTHCQFGSMHNQPNASNKTCWYVLGIQLNCERHVKAVFRIDVVF